MMAASEAASAVPVVPVGRYTVVPVTVSTEVFFCPALHAGVASLPVMYCTYGYAALVARPPLALTQLAAVAGSPPLQPPSPKSHDTISCSESSPEGERPLSAMAWI